MKLFDTEHHEDFGHEWFFQVFVFRNFALLDLTIQWDSFGYDELFPAIELSVGSRHLLGGYFRWGKFQFDCGIIDGAPRDLGWYRDKPTT